jgi:hypothetical protein
MTKKSVQASQKFFFLESKIDCFLKPVFKLHNDYQ